MNKHASSRLSEIGFNQIKRYRISSKYYFTAKTLFAAIFFSWFREQPKQIHAICNDLFWLLIFFSLNRFADTTAKRLCDGNKRFHFRSLFCVYLFFRIRFLLCLHTLWQSAFRFACTKHLRPRKLGAKRITCSNSTRAAFQCIASFFSFFPNKVSIRWQKQKVRITCFHSF